MLMIKSMWCK